MTRVWQWNRAVTVREVLEDLRKERSIAYTTVMTVLDNLHQKGWVRRESEGRAYRYTAVSTRAAYSAVLMNEAWSRSDNPAAALVAFFGMMSPEQREALRDASRIARLGGDDGNTPPGGDVADGNTEQDARTGETENHGAPPVSENTANGAEPEVAVEATPESAEGNTGNAGPDNPGDQDKAAGR